MKINITEEALDFIKNVANERSDMIPSVRVKKGGCAGTIFFLTMSEKNETDTIYDVSGLKISVSDEVLKNSDDISISLKQSLGTQIIVKNNSADTLCNCGKSFKSTN